MVRVRSRACVIGQNVYGTGSSTIRASYALVPFLSRYFMLVSAWWVVRMEVHERSSKNDGTLESNCDQKRSIRGRGTRAPTCVDRALLLTPRPFETLENLPPRAGPATNTSTPEGTRPGSDVTTTSRRRQGASRRRPISRGKIHRLKECFQIEQQNDMRNVEMNADVPAISWRQVFVALLLRPLTMETPRRSLIV